MRKCELCNSVARMYCDSDRAILCWDCDSRVHAANFLVAKHSRTLLCHACQAATPWTGSGPRLRPTVSVCETCVHVSNRKDDEDNNDDSDDDDHNLETEDEDEDDDDDSGDGNNCGDGDGDGDGEDEGNDQVVPVSFTPPPLVSSSSSSEESSGRLRSSDTTIGALKRMKTGRLVLSQAHGNNIKTQLRLWVYFTDSLSRSCIKNMMIKRNKKVI